MKLTLINRPPVSSTIASPAVSPAEGEIGAPPKLHPEARVKDDPGIPTNSNAVVGVIPAVDEIAAPPSISTKEQHPRPRHTDDSPAPPTNSKKAESNAHRGLSDANTTGLSSTVKETLAACPQCVSLSVTTGPFSVSGSHRFRILVVGNVRTYVLTYITVLTST
jgi:hypothetical protein